MNFNKICEKVHKEKISETNLHQFLKQENISSIYVRECSICNSPLYYYVLEHLIEFDSNCDCSIFRSRPEVISFHVFYERILGHIKNNPQIYK